MNTMEQCAEVFDVGLALSSVGGDSEFLTEVVGLIHAAWPTLLADIREEMALGREDGAPRQSRGSKRRGEQGL